MLLVAIQITAAQDIESLIEQAESENPEAQYQLGQMFESGEGMANSAPNIALGWYGRAANNGHGLAQKKLGDLYYNGELVDQSATKAFTWYSKAAKNNIPEALYMIGRAYYYGNGVKQSMATAIHNYQRAVTYSYPPAMAELARLAFIHTIQDVPHARAIELAVKAARQKNTSAMYLLATLYENGKYVRTNERLTIEYHSNASSEGYGPSSYWLGHYYETRSTPDLKRAELFYLKAIQQGHREAAFKYARLQIKALTGNPNLDAAQTILEKEVSLRNPEAMHLMGELVWNSTNQDAMVNAIEYWRAAGDYGPSLHRLSTVMSMEGGPYRKNDQKARLLLRQAANQGYLQAQFEIGEILIHGDNQTKRNPVYAYAFLNIAASRGHEGAEAARDSLELQIDSHDLRKAKLKSVDLFDKTVPYLPFDNSKHKLR